MSQLCIAVVEYDAEIRELFDLLLTSAGYQTALWSPEKDALFMIREHKPDLVILDLWLEDRDAGGEVLGMMELDSTTKHIPVIICTAHSGAVRYQADHFRDKGYIVVEKPFAIDDLLAKIAFLLGAVPLS